MVWLSQLCVCHHAPWLSCMSCMCHARVNLKGSTRPQVTLSGLEHGLTPIAEACPAVHVFDRPALCLDALWLPYRRDPAELEACVRLAGPVKAIFGHADVVRVQGIACFVVLPASDHDKPWSGPGRTGVVACAGRPCQGCR